MTSVDWEKEITQEEFLEALAQIRQISVSPRYLTEWRRRGWVPELQRRSYPGRKEPVYVWDEAAVDQALYLCDVLRVSHADHWVKLALWLKRYPVDFAAIRQRWLDALDTYLQMFTQGQGEEHDPADEPEDHVSRVMVQWKSRWKHTPHPPKQLREVGVDTYAQWAEILLCLLLIPDYELDEGALAALFGLLQTIEVDAQAHEEAAEHGFSWVRTLQDLLAFPRLREVIEQATPEAWEQARQDYEALCQLCATYLEHVARAQGQPREVTLLLFVNSGFYLVPVALALRWRGYGQWIDKGYAGARELLANPDIWNRFAEQVARRHAEPSE